MAIFPLCCTIYSHCLFYAQQFVPLNAYVIYILLSLNSFKLYLTKKANLTHIMQTGCLIHSTGLTSLQSNQKRRGSYFSETKKGKMLSLLYGFIWQTTGSLTSSKISDGHFYLTCLIVFSSHMLLFPLVSGDAACARGW